MAREKFENRSLSGPINVACKYEKQPTRYWVTTKEETIARIKHIVNEYSAQGYTLTLRQLHYQLVSNNWIINHISAYAKLGDILDDCKYAGIIDWDAIEDRGRIPYIPYSVDGVKEALTDTIEQYRRNRQEGQKNVVELWTEKDALSGILRRTTSAYHVRLVVNKGYTSSSALYNTYERIVEAIMNGKRFTILYFGDHDPSGLDMVRDIRDRLMTFLTKGDQLAENEKFIEIVDKWAKEQDDRGIFFDMVDHGLLSKSTIKQVNRGVYDKLREEWNEAVVKLYLIKEKSFQVIPIGLTQAQIKRHKLPPNPTKLTDSRAKEYIKQYGRTCWEVDALKPNVLTNIVESNIQEQIDVKLFEKIVNEEKKDITKLKKIIKNHL